MQNKLVFAFSYSITKLIIKVGNLTKIKKKSQCSGNNDGFSGAS